MQKIQTLYIKNKTEQRTGAKCLGVRDSVLDVGKRKEG